jgi:hypothetical protein
VGLFSQPSRHNPETINSPQYVTLWQFFKHLFNYKETYAVFQQFNATVHDTNNCTVCYLKISGDGIVNGIVAYYHNLLKNTILILKATWGGGGGIQGALPSISTLFFKYND